MTPLSVIGLFPSNSAPNAWWALSLTAARNTPVRQRARSMVLIISLDLTHGVVLLPMLLEKIEDLRRIGQIRSKMRTAGHRRVDSFHSGRLCRFCHFLRRLDRIRRVLIAVNDQQREFTLDAGERVVVKNDWSRTHNGCSEPLGVFRGEVQGAGAGR